MNIVVFYENRFADAMRTCYSRNDHKTIKEAQDEIVRMGTWEKPYRPAIYHIYVNGQLVDSQTFMDMEDTP